MVHKMKEEIKVQKIYHYHMYCFQNIWNMIDWLVYTFLVLLMIKFILGGA